ncbi:hypothetical protein [Salinibacillus xinjiangensis]|uniref:Uncharacterized protein n=1 Tax=Salinibacillus xinjiangensis TaxID=1229268 RepID=A0A6G1X8C8_9BACI|nr:hypothetical protein [Salinibacillus xinjiangensis]MRG87130.1 hypothetical protein [Salinibacillus xinjiangensis]
MLNMHMLAQVKREEIRREMIHIRQLEQIKQQEMKGRSPLLSLVRRVRNRRTVIQPACCCTC